jgi:type II secretory pathway pseudopilin PulG
MGTVRGAGTAGSPGFSLIELLVAMAIWMLVIAGAWSALQSAFGRFGAETDATDANQRIRSAVEALSGVLVKAAAVLPDGAGAVTVMYLDDAASRTTIGAAMPRQSGDVLVNADPGCPAGDAACGLTTGDTVVILEAGEFDPYEVRAVAGSRLTLSHLAADAAGSHPAGAVIARAVVREFYLDADGQLVRQDAGGSAVPVVDGASGLAFDYFDTSGGRLDDSADPAAIASIETHLSLQAKAGDVTVSWRTAPRNLGGTP